MSTRLRLICPHHRLVDMSEEEMIVESGERIESTATLRMRASSSSRLADTIVDRLIVETRRLRLDCRLFVVDNRRFRLNNPIIVYNPT